MVEPTIVPRAQHAISRRDIDPAAIASDIQAERSRRKQAARPEGS